MSSSEQNPWHPVSGSCCGSPATERNEGEEDIYSCCDPSASLVQSKSSLGLTGAAESTVLILILTDKTSDTGRR